MQKKIDLISVWYSRLSVVPAIWEGSSSFFINLWIFLILILGVLHYWGRAPLFLLVAFVLGQGSLCYFSGYCCCCYYYCFPYLNQPFLYIHSQKPKRNKVTQTTQSNQTKPGAVYNFRDLAIIINQGSCNGKSLFLDVFFIIKPL